MIGAVNIITWVFALVFADAAYAFRVPIVRVVNIADGASMTSFINRPIVRALFAAMLASAIEPRVRVIKFADIANMTSFINRPFVRALFAAYLAYTIEPITYVHAFVVADGADTILIVVLL